MPDYDAFLLVSFGGPEGPDEVMPFLRNVTRGRGIPDERLAAVAEHYYAVGGVSPINQQCRDLLEALRAGLPGGRPGSAHLLGQPQLGPLPDRDRGRDGRRRRPPRGGLRHLGLQLVLQLPAVPGRPRPGPGGGRPGRAADRQDPPLLQPPGVHRAVRRGRARRLGAAAAAGSRPGPAGVHRAQRAPGDGRRQRAPRGLGRTRLRRPVCGRADRGVPPDRGPDPGPAPPVAAGLPEPERARPASRGWNPTWSTT